MYNLKWITVFILFLILVAAGCKPKSPKITHSKECGSLKEFIVDKAYCKKMGLPPVKFSLQYPENFKTDPPMEGKQNQHYNYFLKWDDKQIQTEALSIGFSTTQKNTLLKEQLVNEVLQKVKKMLENSGFALSSVFLGKNTFNKKEFFMLRANALIDKPDMEFSGKYLIQCLVIEPEVDNENGVFMMMFAHEDSKIKSFEDFATKGCISVMWQTFEFNY